MEETLLEYADCTGLALNVDRERGVVRGVKILGFESRNGRRYSVDAVTRARELYEGAKVNLNHPKGNPIAPRDYQDRIGVMRNVTVVAETGLFGDLYYNPQHVLAGQLEWDAAHAPENVGLSHNVLARTARRDDHVLVEAITRVLSVDLVADPATTHGLFEQFDRTNAETRAELDRLSAEVATLRRLVESVRPTNPPVSREQQRVERPPTTAPATAADFVRAVTRR